MKRTSDEQIDQWRAVKSETGRLEFKEAKNQFSFDELLKYCVAIGNEGGGHLLLGIANDPPRPVVGTNAFPNSQKTESDLLSRVHFRVDVEEVMHPDGRVLVFHIPSRPLRNPFHVGGRYYMRSGESLVAMTPDQLRTIFEERTFNQFNGAMVVISVVLIAFGAVAYKLSHAPRLPEDGHAVQENHSSSGAVAHPQDTGPDQGGAAAANPYSQRTKTPPTPSAGIAVKKTTQNQPGNKEGLSNVERSFSQPVLSAQGSVSVLQNFRERVIQRNKSSATGDRERLADAFFEFSESLDQGSTLMYKGFHEASNIGVEGPDIVKNLQAHISRLHELASASKDYGKTNMALRTKWGYYPEQTEYVFGDNPDNLGWSKLANAFDSYAYHLETWSVIQNKEDQRVLNMLLEDRSQFETMLNEYASFYHGCKARLEEMKTSIQ